MIICGGIVRVLLVLFVHSLMNRRVCQANNLQQVRICGGAIQIVIYSCKFCDQQKGVPNKQLSAGENLLGKVLKIICALYIL